MDANLAAVIIAFLSLIGVIVNAAMTYFQGQKLEVVRAATDGMSKRLEMEAFKDGVELGQKADDAPKQA